MYDNPSHPSEQYNADTPPSSYRTNLDLWSLIEPCSSTICICLPCMGPLFRGGRSPSSLVNSVRSVFSIKSTDSLGKHWGYQEDVIGDWLSIHRLSISARHGKECSRDFPSREQHTCIYGRWGVGAYAPRHSSSVYVWYLRSQRTKLVCRLIVVSRPLIYR
jgi:hypothetical protein